MENVKIRNEFFDAFKALGDDYWIDYKGWRDIANVNDIESVTQLHEIAKEESIKHYFIIGKNYDIDDQALSNENIGTTILEEFKKLYPIYLMMRSE